MYLGDTGSILIGYIIGFCLIEILSSKYWYLCVSLYSYVILDCSLTKLKKILYGKSVFNRNFSYFFHTRMKIFSLIPHIVELAINKWNPIISFIRIYMVAIWFYKDLYGVIKDMYCFTWFLKEFSKPHADHAAHLGERF